MTEVDKLKGLLEEAREFVRPLSQPCIAPTCIACDLTTRIDAALAEPVADCSRCETLRELADTAAAEQGLAQRRMMEAQRERDEARAEVEFLRGVGCNELDGTDVRGPCGACLKCARRERDEARARVAEVEKERDLARVNRDIGYKTLKEVADSNAETRRAIQFTLVALHEAGITPALSMAQATTGTALATIVSGLARDRNEERAKIERLRKTLCGDKGND
jgi:hypothetical protein